MLTHTLHTYENKLLKHSFEFSTADTTTEFQSRLINVSADRIFLILNLLFNKYFQL